MKKLILSIIVLLFAVGQGWGTDYYVRPHATDAACSYGSCDGTSYANAWEGFSGGDGTAVNWSTVDSGDGKLFVCGTHREHVTVGVSGEEGAPVEVVSCTISRGASTDDPGTILGSTDLGDTGDWTEEGSAAAGDITQWAVIADGDSKISTHVDAAYNGSLYGAKYDEKSTTTPAAYAITTDSSAIYHLTFYIKSPDWSLLPEENRLAFWLQAPTAQEAYHLWFKRSGTNVQFYSEYADASDNMSFTTFWATSDTNWHKIDIQLKADTGGAGYHKVYLDDGEEHNSTGLTSGFSLFNRIQWGMSTITTGTALLVYYDDFLLTDGTDPLLSEDFETASSKIWYATAATEIGILVFDSEASVGNGKASKAAAISGGAGCWWWDDPNNRIYLMTDGDTSTNPGTYYSSIEVGDTANNSALGIISMIPQSYVTIEGLNLRYGGGCGIVLNAWGTSASNVIIENNEVAFCGGPYPIGGNAIHIYAGTISDVIVRNNYVHDIWDAGLTIQDGVASDFDDVYFYNNVSENNWYGFEFGGFHADTTLDNIFVYNNTFYNSGQGWSSLIRTTDTEWGSGINIWGVTATVATSEIKNNIFHTSKTHAMYQGSNLTGITSDYNLFYPDGAALFYYNGSYYNFGNWATATSLDSNSVNSDPDLNTTNFTLEAGSVACNGALPISGYNTRIDPTSSWPDDVRLMGSTEEIGAYGCYKGARLQ